MKFYFSTPILIFSFISFLRCSQGSVGNSLNEKSFVLQRLIIFINTNTSSTKPIFYLYDDRGDSNLNQFQITSNSTTYTINLLTTSQLNLESFSLYLSKSSDLLARDNPKHLGENTVPELTNTGSVTERFYTYSSLTPLSFSGLSASEDLLGSNYKQEITGGLPIPRGTITKGLFTFKPTIQLNINQGPAITINYPSSLTFSIPFNCPVNHSGFSESILSIGLKYSDIFKDSGTAIPISNASGGTPNLNFFSTALEKSGFISQYNCIKK